MFGCPHWKLTLEDLKGLLLNNEVTNFDPVAEAFKVYDPTNTGFVDTTVRSCTHPLHGHGFRRAPLC